MAIERTYNNNRLSYIENQLYWEIAFMIKDYDTEREQYFANYVTKKWINITIDFTVAKWKRMFDEPDTYLTISLGINTRLVRDALYKDFRKFIKPAHKLPAERKIYL